MRAKVGGQSGWADFLVNTPAIRLIRSLPPLAVDVDAAEHRCNSGLERPVPTNNCFRALISQRGGRGTQNWFDTGRGCSEDPLGSNQDGPCWHLKSAGLRVSGIAHRGDDDDRKQQRKTRLGRSRGKIGKHACCYIAVPQKCIELRDAE
jgi:hypothetical protein